MSSTTDSQTIYREDPARASAGKHSRIGTAWATLAVFVVLLLLLAIFILQNSNKVRISFFGFHGDLSFGVGMLLAAVAGSILTLLIGSIRILQLKSRRSKVTI